MKSSLANHWPKRLLSLCCLVALMSVTEQAMAKLTITKPKVTSTPYSGLGKKDKSELACNGFYTWITTDEHGNTQVYVNDDGGTYSKEEKYRVELPENCDWSRVTIIGGKSTDSRYFADSGIDLNTYNESDDVCESVHIKMDGGLVSDIVLAKALVGTLNFVTGDAVLDITGGTVYSITSSDYIRGNISISLSNVRYSGSGSIFLGREEATKSRTTLFVNNNCTFYIPGSSLTTEEVEGCRGAVIPDPERNNVVHAINNVLIPENHTIVCDTLYYNRSSITFRGYVDVRKCSGLIYAGTGLQPMFRTTHLTVKQHQHIQNLKTKATCLKAATYDSYCDVCGVTLTPTLSQAALGHNMVEDEAVEPTCLSSGHTAGTHCSRCGVVGTRKFIQSATGHQFGEPQSSTLFSACFGKQPITFQKCTKCDYVHTSASSNNHNWHSLGDPVPSSASTLTKGLIRKLISLSRPATCEEAGLTYDVCMNCNFIRSVIVPAKGHSIENVAAVAATCTEGGMGAYSACRNCDYKYYTTFTGSKGEYKINTIEFYDLADRHTAPLGHKYGVEASYIKVPEAHVTDATCDDDEIYHQSCSRCGQINPELYFVGNHATGHQYEIRSVDFVSDNEAESGILTLGCQHCSKTWPNFQFSLSDVVGEFREEEEDIDDDYMWEEEEEIQEGHIWNPKDVEKFQGYCVHCVLESIDVLPTCVRGRGTYRIRFYYLGQELTATYQNFIRPNGYIHNYSPVDGICHEQHYKLVENPFPEFEGQIYKYKNGDIVYQRDNYNNPIPDNETVYAAKAAIAVPTRSPYIRTEGLKKMPTYNYITGEYLTYPDVRGTNFVQPGGDFATAIADTLQTWGTATVILYDDLDLNAAFDLDQPGLTVVSNGHKFCTHLADGTDYTRTSPITLSNFTYSRTFADTHFAALYLPVTLQYADWADQAELYDIASVQFDDATGYSIGIRRLGEGEEAKANTPYLIKPHEVGTLRIALPQAELQVANTAAKKLSLDNSSKKYTFNFTGNYLHKDISYNREFFMSTTGGLQYCGDEDGATLLPLRWYLIVRQTIAGTTKIITPTSLLDNAAARISVFIDDDGTTGIEQVEIRDFFTPMHEATIYDLQGRRLAAPRQGLNIINGKKVIM